MALRCLEVCKSLSAFLDNQLDVERYKQIEKHISECQDCSQKKIELQKITGQMANISIPSVSDQKWLETRNQLFSRIDNIPLKARHFRFPKWVYIPIGAFALILFVYTGMSIFYLGDQQTNYISVDVCLQEHSALYSEQIFPTGILPEFAITGTEQAIQDEKTKDGSSDLDVLMETHYGIN